MTLYKGLEVVHKKGTRYRVLGVGTHTETKEKFVVYESVETGEVWIRPYIMFMDGRFSSAAEYDANNR